MRRRIRGLCVDELERSIQGQVKHRADACGVLLAVFVHGHDPVPRSAGHAGHGGGVLSIVPGQPYRLNECMALRERGHGEVRPIRAAIVDQHDFADNKRVAARCDLRVCQFLDFGHENWQRLFPRINRDHYGNSF
ncbi:hypothetical protein D3C71_1635360 [compost metagenome]